MNHIRAVVKIFLLIVYTLTSYGVYLLGYSLLKIFRLRTEPWRNLYMRIWAVGSAGIINIKINTEGNPPSPPFFLVANHLSYVDIIPLFVNLKCTFVAKMEVKSWPVLGPMVKWVGVIFIDRTKKRDVSRVNEILSNELNKHQGIVIFPEGTSSGGENVLPFRSSLLHYPADQQIPVHYATIHYATDEGDLHAHESVCFYGGRDPFGAHVYKLAQTKKIYCTIRFGKKPVLEKDRKILSEKLYERVLEDFTPTLSAE